MLDARRERLVVARTDASDVGEIVKRLRAFEESGAAALVDGVRDLESIRRL
jgi:2-methylisocitrate lyase-like PEP mutase family enzyme